jgi:hypothetical protein
MFISVKRMMRSVPERALKQFNRDPKVTAEKSPSGQFDRGRDLACTGISGMKYNIFSAVSAGERVGG